MVYFDIEDEVTWKHTLGYNFVNIFYEHEKN